MRQIRIEFKSFRVTNKNIYKTKYETQPLSMTMNKKNRATKKNKTRKKNK